MTFTLPDLILFLILLFYFICGYKRGLIITILQVFGSLFSFFAALAGAKKLGAYFGSIFVKPFLSAKLTSLGDAAIPIYQNLGFLIAFLVIFLLISIGLHFLANILRIFSSFPILGKINALLGGLLGLLLGIFLCTIAFYFLKLYAPSLFSQYGIFSPSVQEHSSLLPHFISDNSGGFLRSIYQQITTYFSST